MPIIRVELLKGRTSEAKKRIAKELIDGFIRADGSGKPEYFQVIFVDVDKSDWASGYELMSDKYPDK